MNLMQSYQFMRFIQIYVKSLEINKNILMLNIYT